jgi:hypothetical protein
MRMMSEDQEKLLRMLVDLADGDVELVREALIDAPSPELGVEQPVDSVIKYILEHKKEDELAAAG